MKSILAFGSSLTWGFKTGTFKRHAFENRWPNALAAGLNGKARVIEEGLNGRTTSYPDHTVPVEQNGAVALPMLLTTHQPLESVVIIMLGTNDLKFVNRCRAFDAALAWRTSSPDRPPRRIQRRLRGAENPPRVAPRHPSDRGRILQ